MTSEKIQQPRSRFLKVRCKECNNEQIIFGDASEEVECLVCDNKLAVPTGGKSKVVTQILEVLD